ncbi:MAG: hypothetical protein AAGD07_19320 [Planctomycetota bacterium]
MTTVAAFAERGTAIARRRFITFVCCCCCSYAFSDEFRPAGVNEVFTVTAEVLATTPAYDPLAGPIPVSASTAIRVAAKYHKAQFPGGRSDWYLFELSGATLVRGEHERWYWIVQYRGIFDPRMPGDPSRRRPGGYASIPTVVHNRYPVLMTGKLAPRRLRLPRLPAAVTPAPSE